jgi:hypothetical protein
VWDVDDVDIMQEGSQFVDSQAFCLRGSISRERSAASPARRHDNSLQHRQLYCRALPTVSHHILQFRPYCFYLEPYRDEDFITMLGLAIALYAPKQQKELHRMSCHQSLLVGNDTKFENTEFSCFWTRTSARHCMLRKTRHRARCRRMLTL